MGTGNERKYQWVNPAILSEKKSLLKVSEQALQLSTEKVVKLENA